MKTRLVVEYIKDENQTGSTPDEYDPDSVIYARKVVSDAIEAKRFVQSHSPVSDWALLITQYLFPIQAGDPSVWQDGEGHYDLVPIEFE